MIFRLVGAFLVAGVLAACAHRLDAGARQAVMQTDRDFAARAKVVGLRAAFVDYAAPDALIFRPRVGPIRGREAIAAAFAGTEGDSLVWAPEAAEVAASGELAYTWGWYTFTPRRGKASTGNYVSIWRRVDGRWLYVVDLGVPAERPQ